MLQWVSYLISLQSLDRSEKITSNTSVYFLWEVIFLLIPSRGGIVREKLRIDFPTQLVSCSPLFKLSQGNQGNPYTLISYNNFTQITVCLMQPLNKEIFLALLLWNFHFRRFTKGDSLFHFVTFFWYFCVNTFHNIWTSLEGRPSNGTIALLPVKLVFAVLLLNRMDFLWKYYVGTDREST